MFGSWNRNLVFKEMSFRLSTKPHHRAVLSTIPFPLLRRVRTNGVVDTFKYNLIEVNMFWLIKTALHTK